MRNKIALQGFVPLTRSARLSLLRQEPIFVEDPNS